MLYWDPWTLHQFSFFKQECFSATLTWALCNFKRFKKFLIVIHKINVKIDHSHPNRQNIFHALLIENWGYFQQTTFQYEQVSLGLSSIQSGDGYCRSIPSKINMRVDWDFRNARDPLDWKLHYFINLSIIENLGCLIVNLLAFLSPNL